MSEPTQEPFNVNLERTKIINALLTSTAEKVRIVLWDNAGGVQSISHLSQFSIQQDPGYLPLRVANGKKLARWALRAVEEVISVSQERCVHPRILIEEITDDIRPYKGD